MSNQVRRPPLRGIIVQGDRIVGGLDLPSPAEPFVLQFNREYDAIGLRVAILETTRAHAFQTAGRVESVSSAGT